MKWPLHVRMLLGLAVGAGAGILAHALLGDDPGLATFVRVVAQPVGQVFLRLVLMLVLPLVFCALALGVAALGDVRRLGRIGLKTLACTLVLSSIAVALGIGLVELVQPGRGMEPETREALLASAASRAITPPKDPPKTGIDFIVGIVPDNVARAAAGNDMLAVMFFALMVGIGLALTRTEAARRVEELLEGINDVAMRLVSLVLLVAPIGVAALLFTLTAQLGLGVLALLGRYVLVVVAALAIHQFVVYSLAVRLVGGTSPLAFFRAIGPAMLTAFSTASSNVTLPTSLAVARDRLRLPAATSRFVLTLGASANQNGTALFEGVTVLFLAQLYGVELGLLQQGIVVGTCILGGIGTAGVPAGSIPVIAIILGLVGVPVEGIGLVLGVDRLLDMCRTTLNVTGDLAIAVIVSRGEPAEVDASG